MRSRLAVSALALSTALVLPASAPAARADAPPPRLSMTLAVDATQAPMGILHARIEMAVRPGPLTLLYPKWIPGEHAPSGPIADLTGVHFFAAGRELEWRRDLVEMYAFHLAIPPGAGSLLATLDYVMPAPGAEHGGAPSADEACGVLNWYTVVLAPDDVPAREIEVKASLTLPAGWKDGGALPVERRDDATVRYAPTTLNALIDSPVAFGRYYRRIELWPAGSPMGEHVIDAFADSAWALDFPQRRIEEWKRMVTETRAVFGGVGHYRTYHWLLTLSDNLGRFGVEHHECSDDRVGEDTMVNAAAALRASGLLTHEFFHSWNGKTRRPVGLVTGGYERPMKDDLLWVYEGLTSYYGEVLAVRSGLISVPDWLDELAANAFAVSGPGRTWRPLQDTADAAPFLYARTEAWQGWRRGTDFYPEGALIWLEADVKIRQLTAGRKSLDDFCALFFGEGDNGRVYTKPYEAADVFAALDSVAPLDWKSFFEARLEAKNGTPPLGGILDGGYALAYDARPNAFLASDLPRLRDEVQAQESLGVHVLQDGTVADCWPGSKAWTAGVARGMKIVAVNGRAYTHDRLTRAIEGSTSSAEPIELIVEAGSFFKVCRVDYHEGLKVPHLARVSGKADLLALIAAPR